jgi:hypothetical protein
MGFTIEINHINDRQHLYVYSIITQGDVIQNGYAGAGAKLDFKDSKFKVNSPTLGLGASFDFDID